MAYFSLYPLARGSVHITSADDVSAPLDFKDGFLEEYVSLLFRASCLTLSSPQNG